MNRKEKIIYSALILFSKKGYTETSIDQISKHAQVSKGLTYSHFKNKEDLLRVVIESTITAMTADMMKIEMNTISSLLEKLKEGLIKDKEIIQLSLSLLVHPQTPPIVKAILEKQKKELISLLSSFLASKYEMNAELEAELLLATIDGLTIDFIVDPNVRKLTEKIELLIKKYEP